MSNKLKIFDDSKNYTAVIVKLPNPIVLPGLDNLVGVSIFGNLCLIPKTYDLNALYVFFPAECQLSHGYVYFNNLYREATQNIDQSQKAYIEDNRRVKAIKFKGNKSSGIVMPIKSFEVCMPNVDQFEVGDEFNELNGHEICRKYIVAGKGEPGLKNPRQRILDEVIDSKFFPEHMDTSHLLKNLDRLNLSDNISITAKLHGTSERVGKTLIRRKLGWKDKVAKFFGIKVTEEEYGLVVGSRHVVKSIALKELKGKNHYFVSGDLWTKVAEEYEFEQKLAKGELLYFEVIGKDYTGKEIQAGYSYGAQSPLVYVYRISNINPDGIEIDLPWEAVKTRCKELGVEPVPELWKGKFEDFDIMADFDKTWQQVVEDTLKNWYLDKPSVLNKDYIEEGICIRVENYPRPQIYKLKSPEFLLHETKQNDKQIVDIENEQV